MTNSIIVTNTILAPVSTAWNCYTQPEHITKWNFASSDWRCPNATVDLKVGGEFSSRMEAKDGSMGFDFGGVYTKIENEKAINYTMNVMQDQKPKDGRRVEITFEKIDYKESKITISFEPETENSRELQQDGWQTILDNFKKHTEKVY